LRDYAHIYAQWSASDNRADGIVKQTKCTLHYYMHSNDKIKQCTASVNLPFQNFVKQDVC